MERNSKSLSIILFEYIYKTETRRKQFLAWPIIRSGDGPRPKLLSPCLCIVNIFEEYKAKALFLFGSVNIVYMFDNDVILIATA